MTVFDQIYNKIDSERGFILHCDCGAHGVEFIWFEDEDDGKLIFKFSLDTRAWYERLWIGIKYIFGFKNKYGEFCEVLITIEEIPLIIERFEQAHLDLTKNEK